MAEHYFYQEAIFRWCPQVGGGGAAVLLRQWSHDEESPLLLPPLPTSHESLPDALVHYKHHRPPCVSDGVI